MSRLVVVSNRVADLEKTSQSGGLAVAVGDALRKAKGLWFGWDGEVVDNDAQTPLSVTEGNVTTMATVPLTQHEYDDYYLGFSNRVLWPAFHYRLDLVTLEGSFVSGYRRVNQRLARQLSGLLEDDDVIWVHDYHLIPLAAELRAQGVRQKIGFFLHIPFPPPELFMAVPEHEWLARAMFSYDVIGFQTHADAANFSRYVVDQAGGTDRGNGLLNAFGRTTRVDAFPIGIDVEAFRAMANTQEADERIARLQRRNIESMLVVGVERLDYTKGLPERLKAFRRLLELYPENRKMATLMQIAPPTREEVLAYSEIREELEQLSGAINGEFADFDWTPVRYIHRPVPRDTLAALFRGSQVGLVTPLRDGMNLVAKEYVAAQDEDNPGVLILSRFAGAAEELDEALLVNPYDVDETAQTLQRALRMRIDERRERYHGLIDKVRQSDVGIWRQNFLNALNASGQEGMG